MIFMSLAALAFLYACLTRNLEYFQAGEAADISAGDIRTPERRGKNFTDYSLPCVSGPSTVSEAPEPGLQYGPAFQTLFQHRLVARTLPSGVVCSPVLPDVLTQLSRLLYLLKNLRL